MQYLSLVEIRHIDRYLDTPELGDSHGLEALFQLLRNQTSNTSGGVYENMLKRQEVVHTADWSVTLCLDSEVLVQGYT